MARRSGFSKKTQGQALARQGRLCASCGTPILQLGTAGRDRHQFGEGVQAHHIVHRKVGGTDDLTNCVIICDSCHYSVHEGGNYRFGTVIGTPGDFPFYAGAHDLPE